MSSRHNAVWIAVLAAFAAAAPASRMWAQSPGKSDLRPAVTAPPNSDAVRRVKILGSQRWQQVYQEFQNWIAKQTIYTPQQAEEIKARLKAEVHGMSSAELEEFLDDWDAKLKVLQGKNFSEAQEWLGWYMSNMADGYRKKYLQQMGLGDITQMTAAQLEAESLRIRAQRKSIRQTQSAFERGQQQLTQSALNAAAAEQREQARDARLPASTPAAPQIHSHYGIKAKEAAYESSRMQFYVDGDGRVGYSLPW